MEKIPDDPGRRGAVAICVRDGRMLVIRRAASVVAPITATAPIFTLLFSFIFNRKLEVFTINVVAGIIIVVIGGVLVV